jgi:allantoicase
MELTQAELEKMLNESSTQLGMKVKEAFDEAFTDYQNLIKNYYDNFDIENLGDKITKFMDAFEKGLIN